MSFAVIILAAGKGTRMNSEVPKVLHPILGKPMLSYVLEAVRLLSPRKTALVVGYGADEVMAAFNSDDILFVNQPEQLGTGHAVACAEDVFKDFGGDVVIINGDFPLIRSETLSDFLDSHKKTDAVVSILTTLVDEPAGYGRVVRTSSVISKIVEDEDATSTEKEIKEINAGAYCVNSDFLWKSLMKLSSDNAQDEYYLPDLVLKASESGKRVNGFLVPGSEEVLGVNNRVELANSERILRARINESLMLSGVTIVDPEVTYVSPEASIGCDTVIYPNTYIYGKTEIGRGCRIGPSVWIEDSKIGDDVIVKFSSYIIRALVQNSVRVGPFSHLRPHTEVLEGGKIGNFVEIKKSTIGRGSKVPHLSYVGDAKLGEGVNIGAGTITCNYDGFKKHETVIEDDVFIGSDTMLVAPIRIGKGSTTGAGSTITKDVPEGNLAIGRARQVLIENWKREPKKSSEKEES